MEFAKVTFPVYSLQSWQGDSWLDMVEGNLGQSPSRIWVGHQETSPPSWARVFSAAGSETLESRASSVLVVLFNRIAPEITDEGLRSKYWSSLDRFGEQASRDPRLWRNTEWTVDSLRVPALVLDWADGWAAYATAPDGPLIGAVGQGFKPDELAFEQIDQKQSQAIINFDLRSPISFPLDLETSRQESVTSDVLPRPRFQLHPDEEVLLDG